MDELTLKPRAPGSPAGDLVATSSVTAAPCHRPGHSARFSLKTIPREGFPGAQSPHRGRLPEETLSVQVASLAGQVEELAAQNRELRQQIGQIAAMLGAAQRVITNQQRDIMARMTINHQQALALGTAARQRAGELCRRYGLDEKKHAAAIAAAIRRDAQRAWGIGNLHDLPAGEFAAAREMIAGWSSLALMRRRREMEGSA